MQVVDAADSEQRHKVAEMNKLQQIYGMAVLVWPLTLLAIIAISFVVAIVLAVIIARHRKKNALTWGLGGAVIVYMIFFWDWLPTVAVHQYYCATEAGFWVYKTPEQWKSENQGVMEGFVGHGLSPTDHVGSDDSYTDKYHLNERFDWVVKHHGKFVLNRWRHEQEVVDVKAGEVLARYVDFSTFHEQPQAGWSGWKFWVGNEHCEGGAHNEDAIRKLKNSLKGLKK